MNDNFIFHSSAQPTKPQSPIQLKNSRTIPSIIESLMKVGQMQIIKSNIAFMLNAECRFQSRHLASAYETLNELVDLNFTSWPCLCFIFVYYSFFPSRILIAEYQRSPQLLLSKDECQLSYELANYLEWAGLSDPSSKVQISNSFTMTKMRMKFSLPRFTYRSVHQLSSIGFV